MVERRNKKKRMKFFIFSPSQNNCMLLKITAAAAGPSTHISINNKINNKNHNNMWQMSIKT